MAEAVVSFVAGKLGDLLIQEVTILNEVRDQIEWIKKELEIMQGFLKDAAKRQKKEERVRIWVAQIRDISYDAEDAIETFISMVSQGRRQRSAGLLKRYSSIFTELITRCRVSKEIKQIKVKINDISSRTVTFGIKDITEVTPTDQISLEQKRYFATLEEPDVVGFKEDIKILKEKLISGDSRRVVVSIVGMGGSGKTTLAKTVYRDVAKDFNSHAFIYLSQTVTIRDIIIRIIQNVMRNISQEEMEKAKVEDLVKKLSDYLSVQTYLVVIDDIWTKEAWKALNVVLPEGSNNSRVLLTTRNKDVALQADPSSQPHEIHLLNESDGWELFLKKVFPQGSPCPPGLEKIGREILTKCGGLPLAIVVLGGLLSIKDKTMGAWTKVLEGVTWYLAQGSSECRDILALSYYELPHYLKPCFLYLGLLPEDFEIKSNRLIMLWIAEGFIQQRGNEKLEDVAEDYLEELIGRSMIQVASKRSNGSVSTCHIHDLLRDLSVSEAKENNFFEILGDDENISSSTRHRCLALHRNTGKYDEVICRSALRSMLCFRDCELDLSKLFRKGRKLLRVLDVEDGTIPRNTIPKEMGEFVHLRYLNFGMKVSIAHPRCFTTLRNLQTLKFGTRMALPNAIWDLEQLRHLHAYDCEIGGQQRLHNLRNLQTLCLWVGSWIVDGLDKLTNLRKLGMNGNIGSYSISLTSSIQKLRRLRSLRITYNSSVIPFISFASHLYLYKMNLDGRLDKLRDFPPYLVKLTLRCSQLQKDNITKLGKLTQLRILKLQNQWTCSDEWICSSSEFPQLESLTADCENLKEFTIEKGAMPRLKNVNLSRTSNLKADPTKTNSSQYS